MDVDALASKVHLQYTNLCTKVQRTQYFIDTYSAHACSCGYRCLNGQAGSIRLRHGFDTNWDRATLVGLASRPCRAGPRATSEVHARPTRLIIVLQPAHLVALFPTQRSKKYGGGLRVALDDLLHFHGVVSSSSLFSIYIPNSTTSQMFGWSEYK